MEQIDLQESSISQLINGSNIMQATQVYEKENAT